MKKQDAKGVAAIIWLVVFPPIGIILLLECCYRNLAMAFRLTFSSVFALVSMFFPIACLTYSILFSLKAMGFGVNQALHAQETHQPENSISSCVHFITGITSIVAASLIFSLCPNPLS